MANVTSGEEANVLACEQEVADMLEETQFFALMDHQAKYLHEVEETCHVHLRMAKDKVTIRGGKKAVGRAQRALADLFKSSSCSSW